MTTYPDLPLVAQAKVKLASLKQTLGSRSKPRLLRISLLDAGYSRHK